MTAIYTHWFSSCGLFLQSTGTEPSRGAVLEQGSQERRMHTRLWQAHSAPAGCNLSSWNSGGYLRDTKVGAGEEVFQRTHISVQACSLTIQVHPSRRTLGGQQIRPTHLDRGGFLNPCPVCTHLLPLAPVKENQPYGKRQTTSSLTLPSTSLQLGLCRNRWEQWRPELIQLCVPSSSNLE